MIYFRTMVPVNHRVKWLECDLGVRYWDDAYLTVQDPDDEYGTIRIRDDEENPAMPFVDENKERWKIRINLDTGYVHGWPGPQVETHYKVCDDGIYRLLTDDFQTIIERAGYVPSFMGEYGDYVRLSILPSGLILNWKVTENEIQEYFGDAEND